MKEQELVEDLNQLEMFVGLIGGLALFLFGMDILSRALKQVAALKDIGYYGLLFGEFSISGSCPLISPTSH